jgi:hypothetical protein
MYRNRCQHFEPTEDPPPTVEIFNRFCMERYQRYIVDRLLVKDSGKRCNPFHTTIEINGLETTFLSWFSLTCGISPNQRRSRSRSFEIINSGNYDSTRKHGNKLSFELKFPHEKVYLI